MFTRPRHVGVRDLRELLATCFPVLPWARRIGVAPIRDPRIFLGVVLVGMMLSWAIGAPALAPHHPSAQDLRLSKLPPAWVNGGRWDYALGTDYLGRDILSRLIYGARVSLAVGFGGVFVACALGASLGLIAGYGGGVIDPLLMRLADVQLSLPYLLFVVTVAAILGPSLLNVILLFGVSDYPLFARMARAEALRLRGIGFVEAARMLGARDWYIIVRHIVPNSIGIIATVATFEMAGMILYEAGLGFLGLSVPPSVPSWGNMLADGRNYLTTTWWIAVFPGLAILLATLGVNLLGDWLRDITDPQTGSS